MKKQSKVVRMNGLAMKLAHKNFKGMDKTSENWSIALKQAWVTVKNKPVLNFDEIYKQYYKQVLFYINGNIKLMDISEDICSEVFMKVSNHLDDYTPEMGKVNTWVYRIAYNHVVDYVRKNKKYNTTTNIENYVSEEGDCFFTVTDNSTPSEGVENKEVNDKIMTAINGLSDKYKQIAVLHFIEEKNYTEIAEQLNLTMANTKVLILRTREKLQAQLRFEYSQI